MRLRVIALTRKLVWLLLAAIVVVSVWTPLADPVVAQRWFSLPNLFWFAPVPLLVAACMYFLLRALRGELHAAPFILTAGARLPRLQRPRDQPVAEHHPARRQHLVASAPPQSQGFTLVGALLIIPSY